MSARERTREWLKGEEVGEFAITGDLLEIKKKDGRMSHWAMCYDEYLIIHLVPDSNMVAECMDGNKFATVRRDDMRFVYEDQFWRLNNNIERQDKKHLRPRAQDVIMAECKRRLKQRRVKYHLLDYNCEIFARELRYGEGEGWSDQVDGNPVGCGFLRVLKSSSSSIPVVW